MTPAPGVKDLTLFITYLQPQKRLSAGTGKTARHLILHRRADYLKSTIFQSNQVPISELWRFLFVVAAMAGHESLFSSSLLSSEIVSSLPAGFTIRPLDRGDFKKGYLDCLRVLTWVGDLTEEEWNSRFDEMARATGTYYLLALEHEDRIVGTGSLVVERKLYV